MVQNISVLENKKRYDYYTAHRYIESYSIISYLCLAILQVHTPDLENKFCASHGSFTDSGINAPQRKKEIERYGEREKLHIFVF